MGSGARVVCGVPMPARGGRMPCPGIVCGYWPHRLHDTDMESVFVRLQACQFGLYFRRVPVPRSATCRVFPPFSGLRFPVGSFVRRSAWCEDMGVGVLRDDGLPGMAHVGCRRIKKDLMK